MVQPTIPSLGLQFCQFLVLFVRLFTLRFGQMNDWSSDIGSEERYARPELWLVQIGAADEKHGTRF